jgi:hypothetical protein
VSASTTICPGRDVHTDNCNLRPSITITGSGGTYGTRLVINFGRRGKIRVKASRDDVRRLAGILRRLADAHAVACGEKQVAP